MVISLGGFELVLASLVVLFLGFGITQRFNILKRYNIPVSVTGGLFFSLLLTFLHYQMDVSLSFDMFLKDLFMVVFFATVGLSAKFRLLITGGKALAVLVAVAVLLLVIQDVVGVFVISMMGEDPVYGLFSGSVSLAGGFGTAATWGDFVETMGFANAKGIGMICATFGLVAGGLMGGPIAGRLINKNALIKEDSKKTFIRIKEEIQKDIEVSKSSFTAVSISILMLCLCILLGDMLYKYLKLHGIMAPNFLTVMLVAVLITNAADFLKIPVCENVINRTSQVSLPIFVAMSLMTLNWVLLLETFGPMAMVLMVQVVVMMLFSFFVVFKVMGSDYDASVIAAGVTGLGLGATPVGIANMNAITTRYGPSPKAFLIVPLVGAFFIDIVNSMVIGGALRLLDHF